ncbi:hypothetical protein WMY93_026546 [Mugilogobius chulae]|uniref:Glutathione S-transferase kappa 1 n=1 Tax=Mugilogobius chulae TaxID=88201 RepID=A0AAW0N9Q5_9GOBI
MASRKVIEVFYDVVSPYSWLCFEVMCRYRNVWNIDLKLRPAFLGGIMKGAGKSTPKKPPGLVPNKFLYMNKDLNRLAQYFDVPLQHPADPFEAMFDKGSLTAMRFVTAVQDKETGGDKQVECVSRELWRRIWSEDKDITKPESLTEAAVKAGLSEKDIGELLTLTKTDKIKNRLKMATQEALEHGAFGFPMIVCHVDGKKEMFFGSDRFELMAHTIGEKWLGPQPDKVKANFRAKLGRVELPPNAPEESNLALRVATKDCGLKMTRSSRTSFFRQRHERGWASGKLHCSNYTTEILQKESRMSSSSYCQDGDTVCRIRVYEQEVIVVPILLLAAFVVTLTFVLLLRYCPERVDKIRPENLKKSFRSQHQQNRRVLTGIDAPPGLNPLEHESIALDMPAVTPPSTHPAPTRPTPTRLTYSADASERHSFLGFASFLAQLGPHPFLPELLGVVSLRAPLVTVIEEMENRDLLSLLWRCRQDTEPPCEMTERIIYTMATQVASALEFLHGKDLLHGNIRARSVLVSKSYTAKLWGLHGVYTRKNQQCTQKDDPSMKKWLAPERLSKRPANTSSDIWSFGVLLFEMASLGEAPFAEIPVNELMQFHQRGKSLKKPFNCSNNLHAIIKSCCQWKENDRPSLSELSRKLSAAEKSASDKPIKSPGPVNIEQYLQEAGYGETNNYTVF